MLGILGDSLRAATTVGDLLHRAPLHMTLHQPSAAVGFGAQQRGVNMHGPAILSDADIENDHGQSVVLQHLLLSQIKEFIEGSDYQAATVTSAEGGGGVLPCYVA